MKKQNADLYFIEWCDAQTHVEGWHDLNDVLSWAIKDNWVICQVGYLLKETKEYIVIASQYNPQIETEDQFGVITKIPTTWIRKKKRIPISFYGLSYE